MGFGEVAFSGSRTIFWCVTPVLLLCGIGVPLIIDDWTLVRGVVVGAISGGCFLAIPALYDARRFWWAARALTGIVFVAYVAYLAEELLFSGEPIAPTRPGEASPLNSILGFLLIALPSLWYTIFGRFSLRPRAEKPGVAMERLADHTTSRNKS